MEFPGTIERLIPGRLRCQPGAIGRRGSESRREIGIGYECGMAGKLVHGKHRLILPVIMRGGFLRCGSHAPACYGKREDESEERNESFQAHNIMMMVRLRPA